MSDSTMADRPGGLQSRMVANVHRPAIRPAADEDIDPIDVPRRQPEPTPPDATVAALPEIIPPAALNPEVRPSPGPITPLVPTERVIPRRTKRHEALIQINVKLTPAIREMLDLVAEHEGLTIRDTLQMVITEYARLNDIERPTE